jgi:hypothetical protein
MKIIIFLAVIGLPILTHAQSADSSAKSPLVTTSPRLGGINVSGWIAPIKANGNTFTMQSTVVDLGIPIVKDFSTAHPIFIKAGIRYQDLSLSNENRIGGNNFQSITVPLLFSYSLSHTTNLTVIGLASINGDFKTDIRSEDILYTAGIRIGFQPNRTLRYGVTLTYISDYTGKYLIPIPDIDWTISNKLSLSAIVPARISLKYKLSPKNSLGITGGYQGNVFRLTADDKQQYLQLQQYSAGLIYDLKLGQRFKFNLIAGHTFVQKLETFDMDQKVPFDGFSKLHDRRSNVSYQQNSFLFQAGISYEF